MNKVPSFKCNASCKEEVVLRSKRLMPRINKWRSTPGSRHKTGCCTARLDILMEKKIECCILVILEERNLFSGYTYNFSTKRYYYILNTLNAAHPNSSWFSTNATHNTMDKSSCSKIHKGLFMTNDVSSHTLVVNMNKSPLPLCPFLYLLPGALHSRV